MPETDIKEAPVRELPKIVHPDMAPRAPATGGTKQRRTTVRVAKLINATDPNDPRLTQVPIEPSHNNHGSYDSGAPLRHYLNKGFMFPHEYDPAKYTFLYCAVS